VDVRGAQSYRLGNYRLESPRGLLYCANRLVPLAPKDAQTLLLLVEKAGEVVEQEGALKQVWRDTFIEEGSLTRTISVLRKAFDDEAKGRAFIATISKRGYRLGAS